jgi:short-chain Z-isoprenyl diphosphate synthase
VALIDRATELVVTLPLSRRLRATAFGWLLAPIYAIYTRRLWTEIRHGPIPRHLALILDGNRRFARARKLGSMREAYAAGAGRVDDVLMWCEHAGVEAVTLWVMSVDNLRRPEEQVSALSSVVEEKLGELAELAERRRWRLRGIGRRELVPPSLRDVLEQVERATSGNHGLIVQFAAGYGGREEIVDALRRWAEATEVADLPVREALARLDPHDLKDHLYAGDVPDPDLILRTSGEVRLSGFLLWQSVYSEFYFTDVLWPEFREVDFLRALREYQGRQRRFGA